MLDTWNHEREMEQFQAMREWEIQKTWQDLQDARLKKLEKMMENLAHWWEEDPTREKGSDIQPW